MGKGNKSAKKVKTPSSGLKKQRRANKAILRLKMKINRWERYKTEGRRVSKNTTGISRCTWNTNGLKKQLKQLEKLSKKG